MLVTVNHNGNRRSKQLTRLPLQVCVGCLDEFQTIALPVRGSQAERPDGAALSPHRPAGEEEQKTASL